MADKEEGEQMKGQQQNINATTATLQATIDKTQT
jgi:hypothetical protein